MNKIIKVIFKYIQDLKCKKRLTVIIGAGFSANVGMPIAKDIVNRFDRDNREKLLNFSSSEWAWEDGKDKSVINNGKLYYDWLGFSYIINELVNKYKSYKGEFTNYEDFFQYCVDLSNDKVYAANVFNSAQENLIQDYPYIKDNNKYLEYLSIFKHKKYYKINEILNYLIYDILNKYVSDEELLNVYSDFIKYIKKFDEVRIFTLNHDLLLERLFDLNDLKFSDGFTCENTPIICDNGDLKYYNNEFKNSIKIYKLHGSFDTYRFNHYSKVNGVGKKLDDYDYFKTQNFYDKHSANRINPNTKEIIQDYNFDIVPKFITGTDKLNLINNDKMYSKLLKTYNDIIKNTKYLFLSGYSFGDEHINNGLKRNKKIKFVNHRRSKNYPFKGTGINISKFDELNNL